MVAVGEHDSKSGCPYRKSERDMIGIVSRCIGGHTGEFGHCIESMTQGDPEARGQGRL
jgi:hypothetical protein